MKEINNNVIKKIMYDFDMHEAVEVLESNKEWSKYEEKKNAAQKELENKLEKIDPELKNELKKLVDHYTNVECVELEVYFERAFKEGVRFLANCL